jgi:DNA-binding transcriptional LysR family regulator
LRPFCRRAPAYGLCSSAGEAGFGVAAIDRFTVAYDAFPGVELPRIAEPTRFETCVATRRDTPLLLHVEYFVRRLRSEMKAVGSPAAGLSRLSRAGGERT